MADRVTDRRDDVDALRRWSHTLPFVGFGAVCIVAGGMVAAITARNPTESGTWAAAYLVLVAGVAQVALGTGQALLAAKPPPPQVVTAEFIMWNCANAVVLAGTLLGVESLIDAGGGLLVVALALFAHRARRCRRTRPLVAGRLSTAGYRPAGERPDRALARPRRPHLTGPPSDREQAPSSTGQRPGRGCAAISLGLSSRSIL